MFKIKVVEKIKTHILGSVTSPHPTPASRAVYDIAEKYCRARKTTGDNTAHALCILDNQGHRHTFRISNTYCFSMTTKLTQTRLRVTLYMYVHVLCCSPSVYRHTVT